LLPPATIIVTRLSLKGILFRWMPRTSWPAVDRRLAATQAIEFQRGQIKMANKPRQPKEDAEREDRIVMEIVVDAYGPEERAVGWFCYLENNLHFPFTVHCTSARSISPLEKGDAVEVVGMAPDDECQYEMFVMIRWERKKKLAVPLAQLEPGGDCDDETQQAVEDWLYWVKVGYEF
jgi:hypothetical protein